MSVGATVICRKCRQKVPINAVRYDQNGKDLICLDCYDKQQCVMKKAGFAERREPATELRLSARTTEKPQPKKSGERVKYRCTSCKYKFTMRKDTPQAKRCPYCGKETLEQDTFDINSLIQESDLPE